MKRFSDFTITKDQLEERFTLEELSRKDQSYIDELIKELGKKKLSKKEWDDFFAGIMKDINKLKEK